MSFIAVGSVIMVVNYLAGIYVSVEAVLRLLVRRHYNLVAVVVFISAIAFTVVAVEIINVIIAAAIIATFILAFVETLSLMVPL